MKKILSAILAIILTFQALPVIPAQAASSPAIAAWSRGGSIQPFTETDFASNEMRTALDTLKGTGANYATLIIPYYQPNRQSTYMRPGWNTPTDSALATAIDYAHSIGLKVMLKPHLETDYIEWRGNIDPDSSGRVAWFESYTTMVLHYGKIAQDHGVEDFSIGAELIHMTNPTYNSGNTAQWKTMIGKMRGVFHGKLTYSANWDNELDKIEFWGDLDYIGISAYYDLYHAQNSSVAELKKSWDAWRSGVIEPIQKKYNKDVVFTEIGYRSITNAHRDPWDWSRGGQSNETDQANAYEALFDYWKDYPWMKGLHIWRWDITPPAPNSGDVHYSPQNKKAQAVMTAWWGGSTNPDPNPNPQSGSSDSTVVEGTAWSASANSNPVNPNPGGNMGITVNIKNTSQVAVASSVVDVEIYNSSGQNVLQKFFSNQSFSGGQQQTYNINWVAGSQGNYTIRTGVFNNNWSHNYYWNNETGTISVGMEGTGSGNSNPPPVSTTTPPTSTSTPPVTPPPVETSLDIWWPGENVTVQGLQPFKAMLTNRDVSDYEMYWQVDGDRLNTMQNNDTDYPHKEALVDLTEWNWKNSGPYNINFVAKDKNSNIIKEKSVNITVSH